MVIARRLPRGAVEELAKGNDFRLSGGLTVTVRLSGKLSGCDIDGLVYPEIGDLIRFNDWTTRCHTSCQSRGLLTRAPVRLALRRAGALWRHGHQ